MVIWYKDDKIRDYERPIKPVKMPLWDFGMCNKCSNENQYLANGLCKKCWDKKCEHEILWK